MTKAEARSAAKKAFAEWISADPDGPVRESAEIWRAVEGAPEFRAAGTVLLYMSIRGEVLTREFIERWFTAKRIAIPLVRGDSLVLKIYDPSKLREGYRGIIEPSDDAEEIQPADIDFAIVPGCAFAAKESRILRLGRGGGFYDRLLPSLDCPKAGVCYSCRVLEDLPCDPWDAPLDGLVTGEGWICRP